MTDRTSRYSTTRRGAHGGFAGAAICIAIALLVASGATRGQTVPEGGDATPSVTGTPAADANQPAPKRNGRCRTNPQAPVCSLLQGDIVINPAGRVAFLPDAWADVSAEVRRLKKDLADWPSHCDRLTTAERDRCQRLVTACDDECIARIEGLTKAFERSSKPRLWPRIVTASLTVVASASAIWCALDDQPGNWPCWAAGAAAAGAAGFIFVW